MKGSLDGLRILDFTRLLPGPFGTQILGDLGADVLKVEAMGNPDFTRALPPLYKDMSTFFCALNRNKRSICLNLKQEKGREIVRQLVTEGGYDIVIESFRPGVAEKLGIDYDTLSTVNPRIIHGSLPGYGKGGELEFRAAHDMNLLGLSGILSVCGNDRTGPPVMGIQIDDMATGLYLVIGLLAAVHHREKTGKGQKVETAMIDAALGLNALNLAQAAVEKQPQGFADHPLSGMIISYNIYRTADDRYLTVGTVEPKFWQMACEAIGLPELIEEQYAEARPGNAHFEKISARIASKTLSQWRDIFDKLDACVEPVLNCHETLELAHINQRGTVLRYDHPTQGRMTQIALPIRMSDTPFEIHRHVPSEGQHTDEVLGDLGIDAGRIDELKKKGIVG